MITTRNRASRLRGLVIGGVGAVALLAASAPAASTASAAPAPDEPTAKCVKHAGHSASRMAKGSSFRKDPNSLTRKQAANMERQFRAAVQGLPAKVRGDRNNKINIPVYVHILRGKDGAGFVSRQRIARQMGVLNNGFRGRVARHSEKTPFRFDLVSIDSTQNAAWYRHFPGSEAEKNMKRTLREGSAKALNVYIANPRPFGLLGYATFPQFYQDAPNLDGVVVTGESLPKGDFGAYSHGDTLTHEVGHWLGLYHTFQGRCGPRGDYVTDTPKEQSPNFVGCNTRRDTCPSGGNDPVRNFMDYSVDPCLDTFSRGQVNRMRLSYLAYRAP